MLQKKVTRYRGQEPIHRGSRLKDDHHCLPSGSVDPGADRLRCAKANGLRNLPCKAYQQNKLWLEFTLTAGDAFDLLNWTQALCVDGDLGHLRTGRPALPAAARPGAQFRSSMRCQRLSVRTRRAAPPGHRIRTTVRPWPT